MKYRPSVASAALSWVITAVPAEPEKPHMYAIKISDFLQLRALALYSNLDGHHKARCIQIGGCLRRARLEEHEIQFHPKETSSDHTIYIDLIFGHKMPKTL